MEFITHDSWLINPLIGQYMMCHQWTIDQPCSFLSLHIILASFSFHGWVPDPRSANDARGVHIWASTTRGVAEGRVFEGVLDGRSGNVAHKSWYCDVSKVTNMDSIWTTYETSMNIMPSYWTGFQIVFCETFQTPSIWKWTWNVWEPPFHQFSFPIFCWNHFVYFQLQ